MKNYVEMTESIIKRSNEYVTAQKRKKRIITRTVTCLCCLCLVVMLGLGAWRSDFFNQTTDIFGNETAYPDNEVVTSDKTSEINPPASDYNEQTGDMIDSMDEPAVTPDVTPPTVESESNDVPTSSGNGRISVAVSDDYVAFVDTQNLLKLYDLKTGQIIATNKTAKNVTASGKYIFYQTDNGVYEYNSNMRVCDIGYVNEAYDGENVLFVASNNDFFIWNENKIDFHSQIDVSNGMCFDYSLKDGTVYARYKDLNDGNYYIISITNENQNKIKADDYTIVGNDVYLLKNNVIYNGDNIFASNNNIVSINATDYGIYILRNQDDTHLSLICYDLNGNITDEFQNVSSVREYSETIGVKYNFENQSYAVAITKDGIKQYAIDSLFLDVNCNEKCIVAPAIKSFDIITFSSGKLTTIDG